MNEYILKLNDTENLIFKSFKPIIELTLYYEIEVHITGVDFNYELTNDGINDVLDRFSFLLKKALNGELFKKNAQYDLGYEYNQKLHLVSLLEDTEDDSLGDDNFLFESNCSVNIITATWLYNNMDGDIILEVTPTYHWHFDDPKPGDGFIPYDEFIKDYKPILIRTIPKAVAKEWLGQLEQLSLQIEINFNNERVR